MNKESQICYKDQKLGKGLWGDAPIYMDYQATTPMDPEVIDATMVAMRDFFGNPHSNSHKYGWDAKKLVDGARASIAKVINANPKDILFTSGATESNNLAIKGVARFYKGSQKNHIVALSTEHKCVMESCRAMALEGCDVTLVKPMNNGLVDMDELVAAINERTILLSVCAVHNEIGVLQDLAKIGILARERGVFFHTDAAQAFGKVFLDVEKMNIDLMSISSHKIYGPKGVGAIYIRRIPKVKLLPLFSGGGQERGLRSGTVPVPIVHGFGKAAEIATKRFDEDSVRIKKLSDMLFDGISEIPNVYLNGDRKFRYPGNLNFSFEFVEGESLLMSIPDVAVSSGSACTSSTLAPSYVLKEIGVREELAQSSIRFGIGRFTTESEIRYVVEKLKVAVGRLREMSPLWEMHQNGIKMEDVEWDDA
jgi:cysteine desulfurase